MKSLEKKRAIRLRRKGVALGIIANNLGVAKSTVSLWVRDVKLNKTQIKKLKKNSHNIETIEKRRVSRLAGSERRKEIIRDSAYKRAVTLSDNPLWYIGVSLYWGEGSKTGRTAGVANSDPAVIVTMMKFFREVCGVEEYKFRGHIHAFEHTSVKPTEAYWSKISGIPTEQFYKTYLKKSSASNNKRHTLPHGTLQIYVHDSDFFITVLAWIEYLKKM
jgi:hypothetical protein